MFSAQNKPQYSGGTVPMSLAELNIMNQQTPQQHQQQNSLGMDGMGLNGINNANASLNVNISNFRTNTNTQPNVSSDVNGVGSSAPGDGGGGVPIIPLVNVGMPNAAAGNVTNPNPSLNVNLDLNNPQANLGPTGFVNGAKPSSSTSSSSPPQNSTHIVPARMARYQVQNPVGTDLNSNSNPNANLNVISAANNTVAAANANATTATGTTVTGTTATASTTNGTSAAATAAAPPTTTSINGPVLGPNGQPFTHALDDPNVYHWIYQLTYGPQKEQALLELGRKREQFGDLAVVLWSSFGVMTALLNEIISVYPFLEPTRLPNQLSNRVCNALVLLQCVASHPETKNLFLQAHILLFLFPFLNTTSRQRTFEYLRLTSLGVIGALVKNDSQEVISFLLRTDIVPLCLRIMESSSELSKTVAIFILQKILLDDMGLQYICATMERFYAVTNVLKDMVEHLSTQAPPGRLLKHIIRCYLRLSDYLEARRLLKVVLPQKLRDNTFTEVLKDDLGTKRCLAQLLLTLNEEGSAQ